MKPQEALDQSKLAAIRLIGREHDFRVAYLKSEYDTLKSNRRIQYYKLKENAVWMALYSHINWLAHFRYNKPEKVDSLIPNWLALVFDWPEETSEAFWTCGRNPIAHTGSQNSPYYTTVNGVRRYIQLTFDEQNEWPGARNGYMALEPFELKHIGAGVLPHQQTTFFLGAIIEMLPKLNEDVIAVVTTHKHNEMIKLQGIATTFHLFDDDSDLSSMMDYLSVYEHAKKREINKMRKSKQSS